MTVRSGGLSLGMQLVSYGYGDVLRAVPRVAPSGQRNQVVYDRGLVGESYTNGPLGLEQAFTLREPPRAIHGGWLTLRLNLYGNARAILSASREAVVFSRGTTSLGYRGLVVADAAGRRLPARLRVRGRELLVEVDDAGARYPLAIDPFVQEAKLIAPDGAPYDFLGNSVAISGNTLVAGAPSATVNGNQGQGAAYVFTRPAHAGWQDASEQAKLIATDGGPGSRLGTSVAIQGNTILAGAPGGTSPGVVDVFVEPPGGWSPRTQTPAGEIAEPGGVDGDYFGSALALQDNTLFVGAPSAGGATGSGAVDVFQRPWFGSWRNAAETAVLTTAPGDCLGGAVAVQFDTLAVGAPCATADQFEGAVYLFTKPWWLGWRYAAESARLNESNGAADDSYGTAVAFKGNTLAVGIPGAAQGNGVVDIYIEPSGGWNTAEAPAATLTAPDLGYGGLGSALAFEGNTVVAGAPFVTLPNIPGIIFEGAVTLFDRPPSGWNNETETTTLLGSDIDDVGWLGYSLAVQGNTIVAGAPLSTDGNNPVQGAAYVFASGDQEFGTVMRGAFTARRVSGAGAQAPRRQCARAFVANRSGRRLASWAPIRLGELCRRR